MNTQNDFLKMLFTPVDAKRSQGLLNVDFKFKNLTDLISPHKIIEDIKTRLLLSNGVGKDLTPLALGVLTMGEQG